MLCEKCHQKEASVFYEETVGNKTRSFSLCAECAKELKQTSGNDLLFSLPTAWSLSDGLFGTFFSSQAPQKAEKTCPVCHASVRDLEKTGKVGCPSCYDTFRSELESTIRSIHGNVSHIGRAPAKHRKEVQNRSELDSLREELKAAIAHEDFESAAILRDKIKKLEQEGKES